MADSETPTSILAHFDIFWRIFIAIGLALGLVIRFLFGLYTKRLGTVEENQKKVMRTIPQEALDHGRQLLMATDCDIHRAQCSNIVVIKELSESMKVIKQAIVVLVMHSEQIPKEAREKIARELVE